MVTLRRSVPVSLLAAAAVLLPAAAVAHDELISSDPGDGDSVEAPDELTLTFSGQIAEVGAAVVVTDGADQDVTDGDPEVEGTEVVQDLADDLAAGDYEVVWRVTSEDGHPISGTFTFSVEEGAASDDAASDDDEGSDDAASDDDEGSDDAADEATDEADEATDEADEATDEATEDATDGTTADGEATGMPTWAWVVMGLGVAGLVALLARTWSRGRN